MYQSTIMINCYSELCGSRTFSDRISVITWIPLESLNPLKTTVRFFGRLSNPRVASWTYFDVGSCELAFKQRFISETHRGLAILKPLRRTKSRCAHLYQLGKLPLKLIKFTIHVCSHKTLPTRAQITRDNLGEEEGSVATNWIFRLSLSLLFYWLLH